MRYTARNPQIVSFFSAVSKRILCFKEFELKENVVHDKHAFAYRSIIHYLISNIMFYH